MSSKGILYSLDFKYDLLYDHTEGTNMNERVTVTLPEQVVRDIERQEHNRSKFILQAVQNELERRRIEGLQRSLSTPHPDSEYVDQAGIVEWIDKMHEGDEDLVNIKTGESVRWIPGKGWTKEE
jgi:Arc/MetJ-type ribon-helix-helix transcriptional regulator